VALAVLVHAIGEVSETQFSRFLTSPPCSAIQLGKAVGQALGLRAEMYWRAMNTFS